MISYDRNQQSTIASDFSAHEHRVLSGEIPRLPATLSAAPPNRAKFGVLNDGKREQEVLTPREIIERVRQSFGDHIALDPCSPSKNAPSFFAEERYTEAMNGLVRPWRDRTFFNPPYNDLKPWLEKAQAEARAGARIVGLVPLRARRLWFQKAMRSCTSITFEGPTKFVGHKAAIPFDIVIMSWNCSVKGSTIGSFARGEW